MAKVPIVLAVDDESIILDLYQRLLSKEGYIVDTAKTGREALAKIQKNRPDLVLLDIVMPEVNGYEVCKQIKQDKNTSDIPVIIVTALDDREALLTGLRAGANEFLTKPLDAAELTLRVSNILAVKEYQDRLKDYQADLERQVKARTAKLDETMRELAAAHLDTIYRLSRAAEYKDEATGKHIRRIGLYSGIIAKEYGLEEEEVRVVTQAAPLHDVGKIGIPDEILLKQGKLTPEERAVMETHTLIGAEILGKSWDSYLQAGEVIALSHHEWFDGSGYPRGLKGEEIPLYGRVAALADVFDALTSIRPYKPAYDIQKSLRIMRQEAEHHFDPKLLEAFERGLEEIVKIHEALGNE